MRSLRAAIHLAQAVGQLLGYCALLAQKPAAVRSHSQLLGMTCKTSQLPN